MKNKGTWIFGVLTIALIAGIYVFDYRAELQKNELLSRQIVSQNLEQVSYIQLVKKDGSKIGVQRGANGWTLLEPIQDDGDNDSIELLLKQLGDEKQISVIVDKPTGLVDADLQQYGLQDPGLTVYLKNNLGKTQKIAVGSVRNYEGSSYLRIDSENKIVLASSFWASLADKDLISYREKNLYRGNLAKLTKIRVNSLHDHFEIRYKDGKWVTNDAFIELDQNKVREMIKKISENKIVKYIYEAEPSAKFVSEKGLTNAPVKIDFFTDDSSWSVSLNTHSDDKALYALTEKPTYLVQLDINEWPLFGNLDLDSLRDRTSVMSFNMNEAQHVFLKVDGHEATFKMQKNGTWAPDEVNGQVSSGTNAESIEKLVMRAHDLKISEFLDDPKEAQKFEGQNMLILKSDSGKLVLQLNWGPSLKLKKNGADRDYFYARTQLSDRIFALEKSQLDNLMIDKALAPPEKQDKTGEKN